MKGSLDTDARFYIYVTYGIGTNKGNVNFPKGAVWYCNQ